MKIAIIIPNHNQKEETSRLIKDLENLDYKNAEVFIVDNGSVSGQRCRGLSLNCAFPVQYQRLWQRTSLASLINDQVRKALMQGFEAVWMLNGTSKISPNSLGLLVGIMKKGEYKMIGLKGGFWYPWRLGISKAEKNFPVKTLTVDWVSWSGALLNISHSGIVDKFDETLFSGLEYVDYGISLKSSGSSLKIVKPYALGIKLKKDKPSSDLQEYFWIRNSILLGNKHIQSKFLLTLTCLIYLLSITPRVLFYLLNKNPNRAKLMIGGFIDGVRVIKSPTNTS